MSKIEELIQQYCPQGVEWKQIKDICKKIVSGGTPSTSNRNYYNGNIPWLRTQEVDWKDIYDTSIKISEEGLKSSSANWIPEKCVIVAMYGATAAKVAINQIPLTTNQACCNLSIDETLAHYKYVYYWLSSQYLKLKSLGEGSQANINSQKVKNYPIPIPPLPIQEEIVKILDNFTALEAELEAELEARTRQYEYYRNQLLSFEGKDVEWKTIKELFDFKNGLNKGKEFFGKGTPIVNFTDVFKNRYLNTNTLKGKVEVSSKEKLLYSAQKNDIFFTRTSETQEDIGMASALLDDVEDCVFSGFVLRARPKTTMLNPKFCSYYLTTSNARRAIVKNSTFTTRALTSGPRLAKIKIPVPPLAEQERIVSILDKFEALVNDISQGIPAEIKARKQQYEYYRAQLLTFKPLC